VVVARVSALTNLANPKSEILIRASSSEIAYNKFSGLELSLLYLYVSMDNAK
jgi:hypothetical protein